MNSKLEFPEIKIYPAEKIHIDSILNILNPFMKVGKLLPRDESDILANLYSNQVDTSSLSNSKGVHNFFIAYIKNENVGCVAVRDYGSGLFEIRSLAVSADASGNGVGSALITFAVDVVKNVRKGQKVFALTRRPNVFIRAGFKIVPMEMFPKKIWFDCSKCKKLECCDEVAVLYDMEFK